MKIIQAQINSFGKWQNKNFDFTQGIQTIIGPNEAGKTTLKSFISGILFGFSIAKRNVNTYDRNGEERFGGSLVVLIENERFRIQRLSRTNSQLKIFQIVDNQEIEIDQPDQWLSNITSPLDEQLFNSVFSFNQEELNEIRSLTSVDFSNRLLKLGAVGSEKWTVLQNEFDKTADGLYKPKGQVTTINQEIERYRQLENDLAESSQELVEYEAIKKKISEDENQIKQLTDQVTASKQDERLLGELEKYSDSFLTAQKLKNELHFSEAEVSAFQTVNSKVNQLLAEKKALLASTNANLVESENSNENDFESESNQPNNLNASNEEVLTAFNKHAEELEQVRDNLSQIADALNRRSQNNSRIEAIENAQKGVAAKYNGTVPKPLNEEQKKYLTNFASGEQRMAQVTESYHFTTGSLVAFVLGFAFVVAALMINMSLLYIPAVISLVVGIALILNSNRSTIKKQDTNLQTIQYGLSELGYQNPDDFQSILNSQLELTAYQDNIVQISSIEEQVKNINSQLNQVGDILADSPELFPNHIDSSNIEFELNNIRKKFDQIENLQNNVSINNQKQQAKRTIENNFAANIQQRVDEIDKSVNQQLLSINLQSESQLSDLAKDMFAEETNRNRLFALQEQIPDDVYEALEEMGDEAVRQQINSTQSNQDETDRKIADLREDLAINIATLTKLSDDEKVIALNQNLANQKENILEQFEDYLTQKMTSKWIGESLHQISTVRMPAIMQKATTFFERLTDNNYQQIIFDNNQLLVENTKGEKFSAVELSKGTSEQLYVAFRFAFVDVLSDVVPFPIIVDDGFVNFDQTRKLNVWRLIQEISQKTQVIYFSTDVSVIGNESAEIINL